MKKLPLKKIKYISLISYIIINNVPPEHFPPPFFEVD